MTKERLKEFLKYMILKYKPKCYFCGKEIDWKDLYPRKYGDSKGWTIHHINQNREDNRIENLAICHRSCHRRWHRLHPYNK